MKLTRRKPCSECPFRRTSLKGWLGGTTPEQYINMALSDVQVPCHKDVNAIKTGDFDELELEKNWNKMLEDSDIQHCAGVRIFYKNTCKVSRNPEIARAIVQVEKDTFTVFDKQADFIQHHTRPVLEEGIND